MDTFLLLKTVHLVGVVSWFAAMTALIALLGASRALPESRPRLGALARSIYLKAQAPAMLVVLVTGVVQILLLNSADSEYFRTSRWLHNKILLVFGLMVVDHLFMHAARKAAKPEGDERAELPTAKRLTVLSIIGVALLLGVLGLVTFGAN